MNSGPQRFTLDGSEPLERHLEAVCRTVSDRVAALIPRPELEGVALGGGYGRGEGGVLRTETGDSPYNDLEFYVFVRAAFAFLAERRRRPALEALGHELSPGAGVEVEFKVLTAAKLRCAPPSMFYYDLLAGHRWVVGDEGLLKGCSHHLEAAKIPLHEAARLLMNRCSGLLFSAERLRRPEFGGEEADFVGRNLAKLQLALGDVVLAAFGEYHWSCRERHARLLKLEAPLDPGLLQNLCVHHDAGVAFKLHPQRTTASRTELAARHAGLSALAQVVWLWLENRRLGAAFTDTKDYALSPIDKCPETPGWRNRLITARALGVSAALSRGGARYPRERLFNALCLMLWEPLVPGDTDSVRLLQRELNSTARDPAGLLAAYQALWVRFN